MFVSALLSKLCVFMLKDPWDPQIWEEVVSILSAAPQLTSLRLSVRDADVIHVAPVLRACGTLSHLSWLSAQTASECWLKRSWKFPRWKLWMHTLVAGQMRRWVHFGVRSGATPPPSGAVWHLPVFG